MFNCTSIRVSNVNTLSIILKAPHTIRQKYSLVVVIFDNRTSRIWYLLKIIMNELLRTMMRMLTKDERILRTKLELIKLIKQCHYIYIIVKIPQMYNSLKAC